MPSSTQIINRFAPNGITSKINNKVIVSRSPEDGVELSLKEVLDHLASVFAGFNLAGFLGFTEIQDVLDSIIYYPINLQGGNLVSDGYLSVNNSYVGGGIPGYVPVHNFTQKHESGFLAAEYKFPKFTSFLDFEPYCKTDIWLPYCGLVNIPRSKVDGKYIEVFLFVDFNTGNATYVIATSSQSILGLLPYNPYLYSEQPNDSFYNYIDEIILTEDFVLGYKLPIGRTGLNDYLRNTAVGVAKTAVAVYGSHVMTPSHLIPTTSNKIVKTRNPNTNRLVNKYQITTHTGASNASDVKDYKKGRVAQTTAASISSLGLNQMQGSVANTNNPLIMYGTSESVMIITSRSKHIEYTETFDKLYGRPLGESRQLSDMHGFVDLSSIRLEGTDFNTATNDEMDMIETIMLSGVILP